MPNRLAHEPSPYLRQHADNPVDWFPWGPDALEYAKTHDKPILLSIGYSACHWCHVMAHESFEDEETARLMNESFVCIKVDREEMPDVDQIYQQALQLQGEHGGWPLTMFLRSDASPFYGGTYFPKHDGMGRPSFRRLLVGLADAYRSKRAQVDDNAKQFLSGLSQLQRYGRDEVSPLLRDSVDRAATKLAMRIDRRLGGFEGAPKFPNPKALELLLRAQRRAKRVNDPDAAELLACVTTTLTQMALGGIYDQIGGGFARYSTDARWLVPHFEKMLYDNGQLLTLYAEAYQLTRDPLYARVLRETAAYLEREMRAPDGGLYTAQDADSEGVEGKYYVWTPEQLSEILSDAEAAEVSRVLDVTPGGNWQDPHGHGPESASILHRVAPVEDEALFAAACKKMLAARQKRVSPGMDDKVLAGNNGLAIAGLAEAGRVLGDDALVAAARRTAEFVIGRMRDPSGRLFRAYKDGLARFPGTLDDHALVADGLVTLYEATGEGRFLEEAHRLTQKSVELFYDASQTSFFMTAADDPALIERPSSTHDHAVPSGMSVALENLVRLGDVCGEKPWLEIVEKVLGAYHARALENPFAFSNLLNAMDLFQEGPAEIVLTPETRPFEQTLREIYLPNRVIVRTAGAPASLGELVRGKDAPNTAYVCKGFACQAPTTDPAVLARTVS